MRRLLLSCVLGVALILTGCGLNQAPTSAMTAEELLALASESSDYALTVSILEAAGEGVDDARALAYQVATGQHILVVPSSSDQYLIRVVVGTTGTVKTVLLVSTDLSAIANISEGWTANSVQLGDAIRYEAGPTIGFASLQEALSHDVVLEAACEACAYLEEDVDEAFESWMIALAEAAAADAVALATCSAPVVNAVACAGAIAAAAALTAGAIDAEDDYNDAVDALAECQTASNGCSTGGGGTGGGGGGGSGGH